MRRKTCGPFHSIQNSTLVFFLYGQNKLGLFYQITWQKKSVGNAQSQEVYFNSKCE